MRSSFRLLKQDEIANICEAGRTNEHKLRYKKKKKKFVCDPLAQEVEWYPRRSLEHTLQTR